MSCPNCEGENALIFREILEEFFYVCKDCLALVVRTPFGLKTAEKDATKKYPELLNEPEIIKIKSET